MEANSYSEKFYASQVQGSVDSAREVLPLVESYIRPASVIDIGCGMGTWLNAWKDRGVKDLRGVDGHYVKRESLLIAQDEFVEYDLTKEYQAGRTYDLVMSLEVGEHIATASSAAFVKTLCRHGDVVLFSAAICGQEGTYHINEQYPSFWEELFRENGFVPIDCLRTRIWNNDRIEFWYRQNILFYVREDKLANYPGLLAEKGKPVLALVHPELLQYKDRQLAACRKVLRSPLRTIRYFFGNIYRRLFKPSAV